MYELKLYDRKGVELKEGDLLAISDGLRFNFYAELKFIENGQILAPFHTFSFHSFQKVDSLPDHAVKTKESRYNCWYTHFPELDVEPEEYEDYRLQWVECERQLEKGLFKIINHSVPATK